MSRRKGPRTGRARAGRVGPPSSHRATSEALARALAHHRAQRTAEAAAAYEQILRGQPNHPDALHLLGVLRAQTGRPEEAAALLRKAARREPRNAGFASDLGNALRRLGRLAEAIAAYRRAADLDAENPDIQFNLGNALREAGRIGDAVAAYRRSLATRPDNLPALSQLGVTLSASGEASEAVALLRRAAGARGAPASVHSNLGNALRALGELSQAEESLRHAIDIEPRNAAAHCNLGNVLQDLWRLEDAVAAYRRAIELDPEYATAHSNLGNALRGLHRYDDAIACGERAVSLAPGDVVCLSNLGANYAAHGDHAEALACFARASEVRHGAPRPDPLPKAVAAERVEVAVPFKVQHDVEQIRFLRAAGRLPASFDRIVSTCERFLGRLPPDHPPTAPATLQGAEREAIGQIDDRAIHVPPAPACETGALSRSLDTENIESSYLANDPNLVVVDDVLTPRALERLWRFCLEATVWHQVKQGYLGAYLIDGFGTEVSLQIAEELRTRFPRIFRHHRLSQLWAYKYDARLRGIATHADFAAVNVNFWVTPDSANRDSRSGGLVVHRAIAPSDWSFHKFNSDAAAMEQFLSKTPGEPIEIPYRQNRAVIFDSDLFHRTDDLDFEPGYENRRINVTMLFGDRHDD